MTERSPRKGNTDTETEACRGAVEQQPRGRGEPHENGVCGGDRCEGSGEPKSWSVGDHGVMAGCWDCWQPVGHLHKLGVQVRKERQSSVNRDRDTVSLSPFRHRKQAIVPKVRISLSFT